MERIKIKFSENKFYFFSWILYFLITLLAVLNHEPSRDEAQAWLIVRDLNLSEIFSQINTEGHPCLWYMILLPFAKSGFPYITMQIINWLIAIITSGIFLFKAPINKFTKLLFVFSYYMIFQYSVVARNYCIIILFLFLIAENYQHRFNKPILYALLLLGLFNTHVLAFGAALSLSLIYFVETKNNREFKNARYALFIMISGAILAIIQLYPYTSFSKNTLINPVSYIPLLNINTYWIVLTSIQNAFIPVNSEYEELKVALFFTLVLFVFIISNIRKIHVLIFLLFSYSWIFYVFTTIYSGTWRHDGLILIFIIFSIWISNYYFNKENLFSKKISKYFNFDYFEKSLIIVLSLCLIVNIIFGFNAVKKELNIENSGSKSLANYIIKNNLQTQEIACYRSWEASSLSPYLPDTKLWFIDRREYGTFFKLDAVFAKEGNSLNDKELISRTKEKYKTNVLLLLNTPILINPDSSFDYQLLFQNKLIPKEIDEKYFLYNLTFKNKPTWESSNIN